MIRLLLLLLLTTPAHADQPSNFWALVIRDEAKFVTDPPPREPTREQRLLAEAVRLIDLCRQAADWSKPEAQRKVWGAQCRDQTDPVERPVELGGVP